MILLNQRSPLWASSFGDVHLWAYGRWQDGGKVIATSQEQQQGQGVELGPLLFATLALLVRAAQSAGDEKHLIPHGFVSMKQLLKELKSRLHGTRPDWDVDRQRIAKVIWQLRRLFASMLKPANRRASRKTGTPAWTKELIENSRFLGYRLAIPAANLHLEIEDEAEPTLDAGIEYGALWNRHASEPRHTNEQNARRGRME